MSESDPGPGDDTVEVNLFGPGLGAECTLVHLGCDRWLLVDATSEERDGEPVALTYLRSIGREPRTVVRHLVATHWHDEDVHGFSRLVQECESAAIWLTPAMRYDKLLTLAELSEPITGVTELAALLKVLMGEGSRGAPDRHAQFISEDRPIYRKSSEDENYEIWALSPSEEGILEGYAEVLRLIPDRVRTDWAIPRPKTNPAGIVLLVEAGNQLILIGGSQASSEGSMSRWSRVARHWSSHAFGPSSVLKVADHGAAQSDSDVIWKALVQPNVHALLTPRFLGDREMPTIEDIDRICSRTSQVYITSAARPERLEPFGYQELNLDAASVFFHETRIVVENKLPPAGHVRLRASIGGGDWIADIVPPAARLTNEQ